MGDELTDLVAEVIADTSIDESDAYDFRSDMVSNIVADYPKMFNGDDDLREVALDYIIDNFID